jgi:hypothetical protein
MASTEPKTSPRAPLTPVVSTSAPAAPVSRAAATLRAHEAQLQAHADAIKREVEPALGDRGMGLHDWELDAFARAVASSSVTAQDAVLRLVALRIRHELMALEALDAADEENTRTKEADLGCVF